MIATHKTTHPLLSPFPFSVYFPRQSEPKGMLHGDKSCVLIFIPTQRQGMLQTQSRPLFTITGKHCSVYTSAGNCPEARSKDLVVLGLEPTSGKQALALLNIGFLTRKVMDAMAASVRVTITFTAVPMAHLPPELELVVHVKETTELVSWETGVAPPSEFGIRGIGTHTRVTLGAGTLFLPNDVPAPALTPGYPLTCLVHCDPL